jgi:hypothetical protein
LLSKPIVRNCPTRKYDMLHYYVAIAASTIPSCRMWLKIVQVKLLRGAIAAAGAALALPSVCPGAAMLAPPAPTLVSLVIFWYYSFSKVNSSDNLLLTQGPIFAYPIWTVDHGSRHKTPWVSGVLSSKPENYSNLLTIIHY